MYIEWGGVGGTRAFVHHKVPKMAAPPPVHCMHSARGPSTNNTARLLAHNLCDSVRRVRACLRACVRAAAAWTAFVVVADVVDVVLLVSLACLLACSLMHLRTIIRNAHHHHSLVELELMDSTSGPCISSIDIASNW